MTRQQFDPYHQWLGIPPEQQPPNHYQLLGIALYESDEQAINDAFDERMTYLHSCAGGENASLADELMNQISAARICLLSPQKKASYDRRLDNTSPQHTPTDVIEAPPVIDQPPVMPRKAPVATVQPDEKSSAPEPPAELTLQQKVSLWILRVKELLGLQKSDQRDDQ